MTEQVLVTVFDELHLAKVRLEGMVLKPNMVIAGKNSPKQATRRRRSPRRRFMC